jgi:hypothetical protein
MILVRFRSAAVREASAAEARKLLRLVSDTATPRSKQGNNFVVPALTCEFPPANVSI